MRVALAFPNTYWVGMSNLGFQTVYRLLNAQDDIACERVFLPPKQELAELLASKTPLVSLESQTPVAEFDVVAFSVSFEWDYVNVLTLLRLAGIPRYAAERNAHHPLVLVGGAVTFVNPEPLAPFADEPLERVVDGDAAAVALPADRARIEGLLDRGPGVSDHDIEKIFERFVRGKETSAPGLGLGLSMVRTLVESQGGAVGADFPAGGGSVFWFELPAG